MKKHAFLTLSCLAIIMMIMLGGCSIKGEKKAPAAPSEHETTVTPTGNALPDTTPTEPSETATEEQQDIFISKYMEYINGIKKQGSGTEEGKLVVPAPQADGPAFDGLPQRFLYDRYGIEDINGDGRKELVLLYTDCTQNRLEAIEVLRYSPSSDAIETIVGSFNTFPYDYHELLFFENGIVAISFSGNQSPTYLFVNKEAASKYDFSPYNLLEKGYLLQFNINHNQETGLDDLSESIVGSFDVPYSRSVTVEEANNILSELEAQDPVPVTMHSFSGAEDIICDLDY